MRKTHKQCGLFRIGQLVQRLVEQAALREPDETVINALGGLDALTQYETLSKLQMLLADKVREELTGWNA